MGGRHCKKPKNVDRKDSETHHHDLPNDLVVEILERLPVKSLARSMCVSKSWETTIRSEEFIKSFTLRSSLSHPSRFLVVSKYTDYNHGRDDWNFRTSDATNHTKCQVVNEKYTEVQPCYVHGLMSLVYKERHVIVNPSTGKSVTLPNLVSRRQVLKRFFGYDPVGGEYKVLCIVKGNYGSGTRLAPNEDQVLTLESSSSSLSKWRKMKCKSVPHTPIRDGICIDGVVYYFAYVGKDVLTLVRFDVSSEELSFVTTSFKLTDLKRPFYHLICYEGCLAIANRTTWDNFDLWVWKDAVKDEWVKIRLSIRAWSDRVESQAYRILGTNQMGEIVFTKYDRFGGLHVTYHDPKKKSQRKVDIQAVGNTNQYGPPICFMDCVDSVMLF